MILARDEVILNEWEYASSISKKVETSHSLVVTNKRIVSTFESPRKLVQREIPISSVQNVSITHEIPSFKKAIFSIVLGIFFLIAAIGCLALGLLGGLEELVLKIAVCVVAVALLIWGIAALLVGIKGLNQGSFVLELSGNSFPESTLMTIGFDKIFTKKRPSKRIQLYIDNKMAKDIVDSIGAIIIDNR